MQPISRRAPVRPDPRALAVGAAVVVVAAALVVLPPLLGAALVGGAIVGTLVLVEPRWGFYLLLLSIPVQDLGAVGELTATNILFALTLVAWLARRLVLGGEPLPRSAVGPLFALFVAALALSLTAAQELGPGIAVLFQWVKALLVYFLALALLRTRRQTVGALVALLIAGAAEGALGLVQYATGIGPESFAITEQFSRAFGTFGRPNSYAGYLEMILPLGAALVYLARPRRSPLLPTPRRRRSADVGARLLPPLAASALIAGAIFASFSRGAWLGTAAGAATAVLLAGWRTRAVAAIGGVLLALVLLIGGATFLPTSFGDRLAGVLASVDTPDIRTAFVTPENFSTLERKAHWAAGLAMFADRPFLGVGLGNFNVRFAEYTISPTFLVSQGHAHNYYIHVAAEAGIVGEATYLLLLLAIGLTALRALRLAGRPGADPAARPLVIAALAVVAAVGVHNLVENLHVLSLGVQLSVVWALPTIATRPGWGAEGSPPAIEPTRGRA